VTHDTYEEVLVAWQRALAYGYRRPGLAILRHPRPLVVDDDDSRCAAVLLCHARSAPGCRVPTLFYSPADPHEVLAARVVAWYRRWKPDAVIGFNGLVMQILQRQGKVRVPGQVGFAAINRQQNDIAGIKEAAEDVGRAAADLLQVTLRTNQWGPPRPRVRHYLDPEWVDGDTLPRRPVATA
jgi:LacI family transcriptional regulator